MATLTAPQLDAIARDVQRTSQVSQIARCLKSKLAAVSARAKQQTIKQLNLSKPAAATRANTKDTWSLSPGSPAPNTTWSSPASSSSSPPEHVTTHPLSPFSQIEELGLHNVNDGDGWMPVRSKRGFELAFGSPINAPAKAAVTSSIMSMPMSMAISVPAHSFMATQIHSSPPPSGPSPAFDQGINTIIRPMAVPRSTHLDHSNLAGSVHGSRHTDKYNESHIITKHQHHHQHEHGQSQVTKKTRTQLTVRPFQLLSRSDQSYLHPHQLHSPCISLHPQPPSTPPRSSGGLQRPISWSYPPDHSTNHNDNEVDNKENNQEQEQDKTGTAAGLLMYLATSPLPLHQPRRSQPEARTRTASGVRVQSQTTAATQTAAAADACTEGSLASTPRTTLLSYYHGNVNHHDSNNGINHDNNSCGGGSSGTCSGAASATMQATVNSTITSVNTVGSTSGYAGNGVTDTPGTVLFNEYVNVATPPTVNAHNPYNNTNSINANTSTVGKKNIKSTYLESAMLYHSRMMLDSTTSAVPPLSQQQQQQNGSMGGSVIMTGQMLLQK